MSASALNAVGLPELVAANLEAYENLAVELATRTDKLIDLRQKLHHLRTTAPLFDTGLFTRHIESAFRQMWRRHAAGLPPASFHVEG
jgi:predicted O-linked N-acetylglucosamine transferase (SPINDLY family)